jgi:hypothetical protein
VIDVIIALTFTKSFAKRNVIFGNNAFVSSSSRVPLFVVFKTRQHPRKHASSASSSFSAAFSSSRILSVSLSLVLLLLKSAADWIGKCFILSTRLHTSQIHTERREKGFEHTPERETTTSDLVSRCRYTASLFLLRLKRARKEESNVNVGF